MSDGLIVSIVLMLVGIGVLTICLTCKDYKTPSKSRCSKCGKIMYLHEDAIGCLHEYCKNCNKE